MQKIIILLFSIFWFSPDSRSQQTFSLDDAVKYGLQQNNEIKLKNLAVSDAAAQVKEFKAIGLPIVSSSVNYQYYLAVPAQPVADFIGPSVYNILFNENVIPSRELDAPQTFKFSLFQPNSLSAGLEVSSMLFDGSYLYGVKAARFYKELVAQEKEVSIQTIKENITKAYLSVLLAQENLMVMENNLLNLSKSLNEIKAMFDNGFAESLDVDRLQLSYDNLSTETENITQLVQITKNLLKYQMNFPMNQEIQLSQTITDLMISWNNAAELEKAGVDFSQRQEYKLIQLGQDLNQLDYLRTKAGYYPTLRGFANVQGNLYRKDLFDKNETGWIPQSAVGLALQIPIYDGGQKSAKLQRVKIRTMESDIEKQNLENSIQLQVTNAFISYKSASNGLENRKKALSTTQNIYNKTLIKFREGVGSSLEVTQAESDLYMAQSRYTDAVYNVLSALLDWKTALGRI
ncbi:MAG: TolC family protein [Saprospiraceae bacterium]